MNSLFLIIFLTAFMATAAIDTYKKIQRQGNKQ